MKTLIITNRNINNSAAKDHTLFGERENVKGASELRLAWAERRSNNKWRLDLIEEPSTLTEDNLPSHQAMTTFLAMLEKRKRNCLFYVHGYDSEFKASLDEAHDLGERYQLGVVLFSWPSSPGGFILSEYRQAQATARNSIVALDRALAKLAGFLQACADEHCEISINMLLHSLGNLIFEEFARAPIFTGETRIFDNIILNAADVDLRNHSRWADRLTYAMRVYATINERDSVLAASDVVNPDRLGNTARSLLSDRITYFDLTGGKDIAKKHRHFESSANANRVVNSFYKRVLQGETGLPLDGTQFDTATNAYRLTR